MVCGILAAGIFALGILAAGILVAWNYRSMEFLPHGIFTAYNFSRMGISLQIKNIYIFTIYSIYLISECKETAQQS